MSNGGHSTTPSNPGGILATWGDLHTVVRAIWRASHREGICVPGTLGTMREALDEPGTPALLAIGGIGPISVEQLRSVILLAERAVGEDIVLNRKLKPIRS